MERRSTRDNEGRKIVRYAGASGASGYSGYGAPNKIQYEPIYFNGKKFVHSDKYHTYVNWETIGGGKVVGKTLEQERADVAAAQEREARAIEAQSPFSQAAKLAQEGKLFQYPDGTYPTGNEKTTDELLKAAVDRLEKEEEEEDEIDDRFDPDRPLIKPGEAGFDKYYQPYYDEHVGRDEAIQNAYGDNRVWTSSDAVITEITKDGVTQTYLAPRVMLDDKQKHSLFLSGFAWSDADYSFKKQGALSDDNYADFIDDNLINGATNQRDGRNPEIIDQLVYRFVRRTKALQHLPPQFHPGLPYRTNVQHSRDKKERSATDWPVSWITYEEDGYTYCEIPYRTPLDLKDAFEREKFKYDGVAKRWYYPGLLDEAMEQRLAALNVRYPGEPVGEEGGEPAEVVETTPEPAPETIEPAADVIEPASAPVEQVSAPADNRLDDVFKYGGYGATAENYQELMEKTADVDTLQKFGEERWGEPFSSHDIDIINQAKAVIDDPNILPELRGRILDEAHKLVCGWETLDNRLKNSFLSQRLKATDNSLSYPEALEAVFRAQWAWSITPKAKFTSKTREEAMKWVYPYKTLPFFNTQQNAEVRKREKQLLKLAGNPAVSNVEALYIFDQVGSINDYARKALNNYNNHPEYCTGGSFPPKTWEIVSKQLDELEAKVSLLRDKVASQSAETVETPVEPVTEEPVVETQSNSDTEASPTNDVVAPVSLPPQKEKFKAKKSAGGGSFNMSYCVQGGQLFVSADDLDNAIACDNTNDGYGLANMTENVMMCLEDGDFEQRQLNGKVFCNWKPFRDYVARNNPDLAAWGDKLEKRLGIDTTGRPSEDPGAPDINRLSDDAAMILGYIKNKADQHVPIQGDLSFYDEARTRLPVTTRVDDAIFSLAKAGILNSDAYRYGSKIELTPKGNSLFNNNLTPEQYDALLKLKDFTENHSDSEYRPDISGLFYDSGLDDKDIEKQVKSLKRRGLCSYTGTGEDSVCSISPKGLTALQENEVAKRREKKTLERAVKQLGITFQENALANDLAEKAFATRNGLGIESGLNAKQYIQDIVEMETSPSSDRSFGIGRSGPDFTEETVTNDVQATFDSLKNKGLIYTDDKGTVYTTEKLRNLLPAIRRYRNSIR